MNPGSQGKCTIARGWPEPPGRQRRSSERQRCMLAPGSDMAPGCTPESRNFEIVADFDARWTPPPPLPALLYLPPPCATLPTVSSIRIHDSTGRTSLSHRSSRLPQWAVRTDALYELSWVRVLSPQTPLDALASLAWLSCSSKAPK
eukprot:gene17291-biopygen11377